jgi:citrate lyase beta subunit
VSAGADADPAPSLDADDLAAIDAIAAPADSMLAASAAIGPGDAGGPAATGVPPESAADRPESAPADRPESVQRQPVHTVYVPADRAAADPDGRLAPTWGAAAWSAIDAHAPTPLALAGATGMRLDVVESVWPRLLDKLAHEPIEDLRIDLEDGYGSRPDDIEDRDAIESARALVAADSAGVAPPYLGYRIRSMEPATRHRGVRSLDLILGVLCGESGVPAGFVVTLPKVSAVAQVDAMAEACTRLETRYGLASGRLRFEVQVEMPQAVLGPDGVATVARIARAGDGRVVGLHFGTYDYTAALGIAGPWQSLEHPAADHAKAVMQLAVAGTGVRLADGSTNVLPVGDRTSVHAAWRFHTRLVRRALERGFYQGWDLHPGQLVSRYLATYGFFRTGAEPAKERLRAYLDGADSATLDEPATARALAEFVLRGVDCGAVTLAELGLTRSQLEELTSTAA